MAIKVWDYLAEYRAEREEILGAIEKVLESGRLILGDGVLNFEKEFAAYCGARFGVGVGNATDAITLALEALQLEAGDEVITVSNTAVPTVSAIVSAGGVPRFVDIDPESYLMDLNQIEQQISKRTRFVLPVHLYGQCVNMEAINDLAKLHDLKIVEDCAQAHGAEWNGKRAGSMSHAAAFSFYPTKPLGGYGDGGMVLTSDPGIDAKLRSLRFYGMRGPYYAEEHGRNSRLDELHAEILRGKLKRLDSYLQRRRHIAWVYDRELRDTGLILPRVAPQANHCYYLYVVRHPSRDEILKALAAQDIQLNISYPHPIHTMRGYSSLGFKEGDFPHTEAASREIFSLPMYPSLTDAEQQRVIHALQTLLGRSGGASPA